MRERVHRIELNRLMQGSLLPMAVFSLLLPCLTSAQQVQPDSGGNNLLVVPSDSIVGSLFDSDSDPDYGKYAPDFVPPQLHQTVELSEEFRWSSEAHDNPNSITYNGGKWIQLHFLPVTRLGEQSTVTITSREDGASQTLNSATLKQWNNSSAKFNGGAVNIRVDVAPGERKILIVVDEVTIGIPPPLTSPPPPPPPEEEAAFTDDNVTFCNIDSRVPSNDRAVGRIVTWSCTGWIISNGAHLSAGHCDHTRMQELQFQVPLSDPDGSKNVPDPRDQYSIDRITIKSENLDPPGEAGEDWAVFAVEPNTETQLLPAQQQQAFYRLTDQANPTAITVTGYGQDDSPPAPNPPSLLKSFNYTQQRTPDGRFIREYIESSSDVKLKYWAYTEGGVSGGPVVDPGTLLAIGIHTNRCISGVSAAGTGFKNQALTAAIQQFPGPNAIYVDHGHPAVAEDGSIFRPYDTVLEGLNAVPGNGILSIVTGSYSVPSNTTIDQSVTLSAPVGPVTISVN